MFRLSCTRASALAIGAAVLSLALIALVRKSAWTEAAGLDVWNARHLEESLDVEAARRRDISAKEQRMWQRIEQFNRTVTRLYEGELSLAQAVDELLAVAERYPEWYSATGYAIRCTLLNESASDREVMAQLLLNRLEGLYRDSLALGDMAKAAAVYKRLTEFAVEINAENRDENCPRNWRILPKFAEGSR